MGTLLQRAVLIAVAAVTAGCSTAGYYAQAIGGHLDIVRKSRPVVDWLADPTTPAPVAERLRLSQRMRDFAVKELKLPDNRSYRTYADLQRNAVVWNVVAAPELSLMLKTWCFPVMGCIGYRGYFDRAPADALAAELKSQGLEVYVYGVPAYSTLGWTNWLGGDPLLNTFLNWGEAELARLIFHELAHQVAYAPDDTTFNESFATAVERIGGQRWLRDHASPDTIRDIATADARRVDFRALTQRYRTRLAAIYDGSGDQAQKRSGKVETLNELRADYMRLKTDRWAGYDGYDGWFDRANNAVFGVQAAYDELVPQFERLFDALGGDFERFYAEAKRLAALPKTERRAVLAAVP